MKRLDIAVIGINGDDNNSVEVGRQTDLYDEVLSSL